MRREKRKSDVFAAFMIAHFYVLDRLTRARNTKQTLCRY
jgi:hypothetical protein